MKPLFFPSSFVFAPLDKLAPRLGLGASFSDPALRRVYLDYSSNGIGDVVNLVPLVQQIVAARPDVDVIVVTSQWRIPFRWCGARVSTIATPPSPRDRAGPEAAYIELSGDIHYHIYAPHWLQLYCISGIGIYTHHVDPFPLLDPAEIGDFAARLANATGPARGYALLHVENTRREWEGRNTDPENLLAIARMLRARGYQVFEIGNENQPGGEFQHLGVLTIEELVYAMKHSSAFIGIDSFPMHVAALYDKPMLGFFAATQPEVVLPPVSRLTVLRNEAIPCNGCVYITRPRNYNKCTLGKLECTERLPGTYLEERFERFLATIEGGVSSPAERHEMEHSWRMAQLLFEDTVLLDRLRQKRLLSNELRRRIAASISSEIT